MSAANRRRGHDCERAVAKYLRDRGYIDAETTRSKLGHDGATAPGDVSFHPLICLEVKDVAQSAWPTWCRQAVAEAPAGTVPVVVRRTRGVPDVGEWECRVQGWAWFRVTDQGPFDEWPGGREHSVDGWPWLGVPFASFVDALLAFDAADQAVTR